MMKIYSVILKNLFLIFLLGLMLNTNTSAAKPRTDSVKYIYIKLKLQTASKVKVEKSPLKYNKHLAFSFTLDDGYQSAYLTAFHLLNGGHISPPFPDEWKSDQGGDGSYSDGLFYTDGCGSKVPFRLAIAINGSAIGDKPANSGHLTWAEVNEMYKAGWDILNHSYHHSTKHGTNYEKEVADNIPSIQQHTGFTVSHFVVPGGPSDPRYQHEYEKQAFKHDAYSSAFYGVGPVINVDTPVNLNHLIYTRDYLITDSNSIAVKRYIAKIDSLMKLPQTTWYNAFSHGAGNTNLWGISMVFPQFKYYMTTIAAKYGTKGTDQIWMAPWQEVYEYIWLRDRAVVTTSQKGEYVTIKIAMPQLPGHFRNSSLSLNVLNASKFTIVSHSPNVDLKSNGSGNHNLLYFNHTK